MNRYSRSRSLSTSSLSSSDLGSVTQSDYDSEEEYRLAQQEWEESLQQLQLLASMVLMPFVGKWLGRRWSHWAYARYLRLGFGLPFFFGSTNVAQSATFV